MLLNSGGIWLLYRGSVKLLDRFSCHFHTSVEVLGTDNPVQKLQWMCSQHMEALIHAVVMV